MTEKSCIVRLLAVVVTLAIVCGHLVAAYTDEENFHYIDKILGQLNDKYICNLPTYDEVDELNKCYKELKEAHPSDLDKILSADQKLLRETLLDRWESFQQRMTSGVVIRSAKKRSFICRIEDYQVAKNGDSVCAFHKEKRTPESDHIFEKNPIVRYVKHLETHEVIENTAEKDIIHTTIEVEVTKPDIEVEIKLHGNQEMYDMLADIPVPPSDNSDKYEAPVVPTTTTTTTTTTEASVAPEPEPEPEAEPTTAPEIPAEVIAKPEPDLEPEAEPTTAPEVLAETEAATEAESVAEPKPVVEPEPATESAQVVEPEPVIEPEVTTEAEAVTDVAQAVDPEPMVEVETTPEAEEITEAEPAPTTTTTTTTQRPERFELIGAELVDDETDDKDLEKLVKLPPESWEFDAVYGYFKWPDENPANFSGEDLTIRLQWEQFLDDPSSFDPPPTTTTPKPKLSYLEKRRLYQQELRDEAKRTKAEKEFGWQQKPMAHPHVPGEPVSPAPRRDRWRHVANNNFCKISYNRDYVANTEAAKKMKSFMSSAKRRLLSSS